MNLSTMLRETGKTSGVVYATGVMKGREVLRMVADCRAQETIRENDGSNTQRREAIRL